MNANPPERNLTATFVGVLGSFLIVAGLVWAMYHYTRPAPVGQAKADERKKNLTELRAAETDAVNNYGWVDQTKDLVRLPVARAVELTVQEYQNPAAARSNLVARSDKASIAPPKPGAPPNPFE